MSRPVAHLAIGILLGAVLVWTMQPPAPAQGEAPGQQQKAKEAPADAPKRREADGLIARVKTLEDELAKLKDQHVTLVKDAKEQTKQNEENTEAISQIRTGMSTIDTKASGAASKLEKITGGWFMVQSPMTRDQYRYVLDVRGGKPDGNPVIQLVGEVNPRPQANRKWKLILLDE
jgi:hypothetical protein